MRMIILALALLAPNLAHADPVTAVIAVANLSAAGAFGAALAISATAAAYITVAASTIGSIKRRARRAE